MAFFPNASDTRLPAFVLVRLDGALTLPTGNPIVLLVAPPTDDVTGLALLTRLVGAGAAELDFFFFFLAMAAA